MMFSSSQNFQYSRNPFAFRFGLGPFGTFFAIVYMLSYVLRFSIRHLSGALLFVKSTESLCALETRKTVLSMRKWGPPEMETGCFVHLLGCGDGSPGRVNRVSPLPPPGASSSSFLLSSLLPVSRLCPSPWVAPRIKGGIRQEQATEGLLWHLRTYSRHINPKVQFHLSTVFPVPLACKVLYL